jgi:alkylhydroperoxidase/carboxymuconolactone decarboxylase family protein YurZ
MRFAAAKQAGASREELSETLYLAMRAGSRAVWTTIKNSIDGIEDEVDQFKQNYQAQK